MLSEQQMAGLHLPIVELIHCGQFVVYIDTFGRVCGLPLRNKDSLFGLRNMATIR